MTSEKSLSKKKQGQIVKMILEWDGKLTWARLVKQIENRYGFYISRQSLVGYYSINHEYKLRKSALKGISTGDRHIIKMTEADLLLKIDKLEKTIEAKDREIAKQFVLIETIWANVQKIPNLTHQQLLKREAQEASS